MYHSQHALSTLYRYLKRFTTIRTLCAISCFYILTFSKGLSTVCMPRLAYTISVLKSLAKLAKWTGFLSLKHPRHQSTISFCYFTHTSNSLSSSQVPTPPSSPTLKSRIKSSSPITYRKENLCVFLVSRMGMRNWYFAEEKFWQMYFVS